MQSPFPHSNSSCALQVEFRAGQGMGSVSPARLRPAPPPPLPTPASSRFHCPSPLQVKSSCRMRSPRQEQLTCPLGVSRQRSWQPPLFTLHGDSSPRRDGEQSHQGQPQQPLPLVLPAAERKSRGSPRALQMGLWGMHGAGGIQPPLQGGCPAKGTDGANSLSLQPAQGLEMAGPWREGPEGARTGPEEQQDGWQRGRKSSTVWQWAELPKRGVRGLAAAGSWGTRWRGWG